MHKSVNPINANVVASKRMQDIRQFGHQAMSYSSLQSSIKEFRHPSFKGFIAYTTVWGTDYVLSDPITSEEDYLKATFLFLEHHKSVVFCQISKEYATQLSHWTFVINGFGVENIVHLNDFKVTWKKRKCLKSYLSKLDKQGYFVFDCKADIRSVQKINDQWLASKSGCKELTFMARPFAGIDEADVRYFYLIKNNQVIGFCTFDPIYSTNNNCDISSYTLQHLRVSNDAPLGSQDYLILNALHQFRDEGFEKISLGLSPMYKRDSSLFDSSAFAEFIFTLIYKSNSFYNFRTIGEHKDHYKAEQVQTYVASPKTFNLKQLCGLLKVNNLI